MGRAPRPPRDRPGAEGARSTCAPASGPRRNMDKEMCMRIHGYCRKQAIPEGEPFDVSATAREAGIRYPTALTRRAWERYVKVPERAIGETEAHRLGNVLAAFRTAAAEAAPRETALHF